MNQSEKSYINEDSNALLEEELRNEQMESGNTDQANLRKYLLGDLTGEEELTVFEERLMTDDSFYEQLQAVEDELIDDYLDDLLTPAEKEQFEKRLLPHPKVQKNIELTRNLKRLARERKNDSVVSENERRTFVNAKGQPRKHNWYSRPALRYLKIAALIIVAVGAGLIFWQIFSSPTTSDQGLAELHSLYKNKRPFEARLTGFDYAPFNVVRGKTTTDDPTTSLARDRAKQNILNGAGKQPGVKSLLALGQYYLTENEFEKAIAQFEQALKLEPDNAATHNDLGTALFEIGKKAQTNDDPKSSKYFAQALDQFKTAIELNPKFLEPRFNRALCLQTMLSTNEAKEAWNDYLELDSSSKWAEEAKHNLSLLEEQKSDNKNGQQLLQEFIAAFKSGDENLAWQIQSRNKEMIAEKLIPQLLAFSYLESEGAEKDDYLAALQYSGNLETEKSGDPYFSEIARFYASVSEEQRLNLEEAQKFVKNGYQLSLHNKSQPAQTEFERAREIFENAGDVWEAKFCDYWIAYFQYQNDKIRQSTETLSELADFCRARNYKWLLAQALNWLSVNASALNQISRSIQYAEKCLQLAEQTSDLYLTQKTFSWLTEKNRQVGQYQKALVYLQKTLTLGQLPESSVRQKVRDYDMAARLFYSLKLYEAAFAFAKEALELNRTRTNDLSFERVAYARLSRILSAEKKYDQALEFAEMSRNVSERQDTEKERQKGAAFAFLQMANVEQDRGDCLQAVAFYDQAIQIYDELEFDPDRYEASKGRLICHLKTGDDATVQNELSNVLQLLEENRSEILEEQNRNSFFDREQNIYDSIIDYEYSKGRVEQALNYSELSRSRSLLDLQLTKSSRLSLANDEPQIVFDERVSRVLTLPEIQPQISNELQIVQYAVLRDKIIVWLITKDRFKAFSFPISSESLNEKIFSFLDAIKNSDSEKQQSLARELSAILFEPFESELDANGKICLIPDKALFHLPFAALIENETGNYLVARYKTFVAPSLNILLTSTENAKTRNQDSAERLLSVGNPKFERSEYPELEYLAAAEREAKNIAKYYADKAVYLKEQVSKEKLIDEIPRADVVHFAGHYLVNENSPLLSGFPLAGSKEKGNLSNYEILRLNLQKPKLIVLSACETELEGYWQGEGMFGAGRTFLAAGVPLIVATQWQVETEAAAELMERFHRFRKLEKLSTVSALQRAQIEMLNHPNPKFRQPYYWAGFSTLGGDANF